MPTEVNQEERCLVQCSKPRYRITDAGVLKKKCVEKKKTDGFISPGNKIKGLLTREARDNALAGRARLTRKGVIVAQGQSG